MTEEYLIKEFNLPNKHCVTCHEDESQGHDMIHLELENKRNLWVYCEVFRNYQEILEKNETDKSTSKK